MEIGVRRVARRVGTELVFGGAHAGLKNNGEALLCSGKEQTLTIVIIARLTSEK